MVGDYDSIPQGCHAWFYDMPGEEPFSVNFYDESWGNPTSWDWDFGDGNTSDEENPSHTYASEGEYMVTLTIFNDDSCTASVQEYIMVDSIGWPGDCQAQYFYYPVCDSGDSRDEELKYQFMDISFGNPTSWEWDFGDGETSDDQNPIHEFEEEGEYEVCLTISNPADSCEDTYCEMVYVSHDTIGNCMAWFDYEEQDSLTVDFEGHLMGSMSGTFTWDFGDSTTGSGQMVSHTYTTDGVYTVTMQAVDSAMGCDVEYSGMVWVGDSITFTIFGNVFVDDSVNADVASVYLMTFDTIWGNLISVDETTIDSNGYYEFDASIFDNCIYFVQAELDSTSSYYGDYVPTYHEDAITWQEAWPVFPFPMGWSYDIYMQEAQGINSGDGSIGGTVTEQEGRGLLSDVEILLLAEDYAPIAYLRTDENGSFNYPELAYGTYVVYTEIVGIQTTPATVVLTEQNPSAQLNIVVANGEAILGIGEHSSRYIDEVSEVFPNPVTEDAAIEIGMKEAGTVDVRVSNQFGQVIVSRQQQLPSGKSTVSLKTNALPPGIYILNITPADGIASVRKFVKFR